jgi:hypothetical protein
VEARFFIRGQAMLARYDLTVTVRIECVISRCSSVQATSGVTPSWPLVESLTWPGRFPGSFLPNPLVPDPFGNLSGHVPCFTITADRSGGRFRLASFTANRHWVAADLLDTRRRTWLRTELTANGCTWIGVPGMGQSLRGRLNGTGLDLAVDDRLGTLSAGGTGSSREEGRGLS